jgi:hypothetical protein
MSFLDGGSIGWTLFNIGLVVALFAALVWLVVCIFRGDL